MDIGFDGAVTMVLQGRKPHLGADKTLAADFVSGTIFVDAAVNETNPIGALGSFDHIPPFSGRGLRVES